MLDQQCDKQLILKLLACVLVFGLCGCDALASPQTIHRKKRPSVEGIPRPRGKRHTGRAAEETMEEIGANPDQCNSPYPCDLGEARRLSSSPEGTEANRYCGPGVLFLRCHR